VTIEYDKPYIEIWSLTAEDACRFFGVDPEKHHVVVLKDKPTTEREVAKYKPEAKLFGVYVHHGEHGKA